MTKRGKHRTLKLQGPTDIVIHVERLLEPKVEKLKGIEKVTVKDPTQTPFPGDVLT